MAIPDVPDGSIVITPKEFYDGVRQDIADIKTAVSPLPEIRKDVDDLQARVTAVERKLYWAAGFAAAIGSGAGAAVAKILGG